MNNANNSQKIILIFCLSLILTIFLNTLVQTRQNHIEFGLKQIELVEQGKDYSPSFRGYHYKYRMLVPFLVKLFPVETKEGFKIIAITGCFIALFCQGLILYSLKLRTFNIIAGMIFGAFSYTIIYSLNYPYLPDAMNNAIITACFLGLIRRNFILVALTLFLGVLNHEAAIVYIILVPLFFGYNEKLADKKGWQYFFYIGCIVLATKIAVIIFLGGEGVHSRYFAFFKFNPFIEYWKARGGVIGATEKIYITFHLLWIFALLGFQNSALKVKRSWITLFPIILFFIVLVDTRRHLSYFLPIIVTTSAYYYSVFSAEKLINILKGSFLLFVYIFISLLAARDSQELFLRFQWPNVIENNIYIVTGFVNVMGIIIICSKRILNILTKFFHSSY